MTTTPYPHAGTDVSRAVFRGDLLGVALVVSAALWSLAPAIL